MGHVASKWKQQCAIAKGVSSSGLRDQQQKPVSRGWCMSNRARAGAGVSGSRCVGSKVQAKLVSKQGQA
ncbi:hypothetical protein GOBAR_AA36157 [Gossypium barbadense]|uniref:Uncharacterized protein n=1 Tax=Gossypium barbadense TaxID=3634 RepID=A0A2P5W0F7_GOSBA|nr:hypothetical protein GOBAR_AA36157 [Gossypium barbadense]